MTYIQTIILAIIEGLTEFLPISSTGHLILAQKLLNITPSEFTKSFSIIIQLSAIIAVAILYSKKIVESKKIWKQIFIAFLPTGIIGFTLYRLIKDYLLENVFITVLALLLGGIVLLIIDFLIKPNTGSKTTQDLQNKNLLSIGLFQSFSMVPGVSRSAASIIGGLSNGLSRVEAVEFSFLLAIPTMAAATGYDLLKTNFSYSKDQIILILIGCAFSFLSAMFSVKIFTSFVSKHSLTIFGIYRIILAIIFLVLIKTY